MGEAELQEGGKGRKADWFLAFCLRAGLDLRMQSEEVLAGACGGGFARGRNRRSRNPLYIPLASARDEDEIGEAGVGAVKFREPCGR